MKPKFIDYINASWRELNAMIIDFDLYVYNAWKAHESIDVRLGINWGLRRAQNHLRRAADTFPDIPGSVSDAVKSIKAGKPTLGSAPVPTAARIAAESFLEWLDAQKAILVKYRVKRIRRCRYWQCQKYFIPDETNKLYCCLLHKTNQRKAKDRFRKRPHPRPI